MSKIHINSTLSQKIPFLNETSIVGDTPFAAFSAEVSLVLPDFGVLGSTLQ